MLEEAAEGRDAVWKKDEDLAEDEEEEEDEDEECEAPRI